MSGPLVDRVALVTGAGSGIGRAHCEVMAERGAHVIVQDLLPERAETVAEAIRGAGHQAEALGGNAADPGEMRPLLESLLARHGAVDILVNNAGISGLQTPFAEIDEAFYDRMMAVHAKSAFFITQALVPAMQEQRWGRIINMSSMFAMKGSPDAPHYTMAKGALLGMTKSLARELAPWNITVNAVAPGLVKTEMTLESLGSDAPFEERAKHVPMQKLAEPRDIACTVAFLASEDAALMTGQTLSPNGGDAIVGI
jgi:3-oxoacyl-[acyl-carrier protein] reductase